MIERLSKTERDGHPSLHTWITGYRVTDRLKTWFTLLNPCRHTHAHSSVCVRPNSYSRGAKCYNNFLVLLRFISWISRFWQTRWQPLFLLLCAVALHTFISRIPSENPKQLFTIQMHDSIKCCVTSQLEVEDLASLTDSSVHAHQRHQSSSPSHYCPAKTAK